MTLISFIIPGPPQPKQRARRGRSRTGKIVWYTPTPTVRYERHVALCWRAAIGRNRWAKTGEFDLTVHLVFGDRRRRDSDNVLKSISDSLNGLAWDDDSQVRGIALDRAYDAERPRAEVTIERVTDGICSSVAVIPETGSGPGRESRSRKRVNRR